MIYASSDAPGAVACPAFLHQEFSDSAAEAAEMLTRLLPLATDFESFKWSVAGLAGFTGQHAFARFLDGLDYYEGRFHHVLLGGPFPPET
jgi:hypothetical protein